MRNILHSKPENYFSQIGFTRMITDYVSPENFEGLRVLDVGCGFGSFALTALAWNPAEVFGVDVTAADVQTAQQYIRDPRVSLQVGSALELKFPDAYFDTVTSWEVLEHIPKNTEALYFSEIYRVLKPGGHFYLSTPLRNFWSNLSDPAWWLVGHRHYSEKDLRSFATKAGFLIADVARHGNFFAILDSLNMYIAKWIFRRDRFFQSYFAEKTKAAYQLDLNGFVGLRAHLTKQL